MDNIKVSRRVSNKIHVRFGEDAGSLVGKDYTRDFKFNGKVGPVNMHLGDDLWSY